MSTDNSIWTVAHFMTEKPCTVEHDLSIDDARDRMEANNIRHLLVTRAGLLVGVISSRDITFAFSLAGAAAKFKKMAIGEAMSQSVYCCEVNAPVEDVAAEMEEHRYGCAVALQDDYVVGIFTTTDALRAVRALIRGEKVEPRTTSTHLVDLTKERERVEHRVRMSDALRGSGPTARDGMIGTVGLG